ncbi:MAG: signal peptidase Aspartic peptidase family [Pedosphaera sp.]|nr:signal peptidase Aspartic peptidase family [Pedosphaera sp.]
MNYIRLLKQLGVVTSSRGRRLMVILLLLLLTVGCDQTSKHFARVQLSQSGSVTTPGGFLEFSLAENPGAFLSLGASLPGSLRIFLLTLGVGLGLSILFVQLTLSSRFASLTFFGLALIGAGGMSNLLDRIVRHGLVTDFAIVRIGPFHTGIFNWADLVVMVGITVVLASLCLRSEKSGV